MEEAEALRQKLEEDLTPQNRAETLNRIAWLMMDKEAKESVAVALQAYEHSMEHGLIKEAAKALIQMGFNTEVMKGGQTHEALEYSHKAIDMLKSIDAPAELSQAYAQMSMIYWNIADYDNGFFYNSKALEIAEEHNIIYSLAWGRYSLGTFHADLKDYEPALENYKVSRIFFEEAGEEVGLGRVASGLNVVYLALDNIPEALKEATKALNIYKGVDNKSGISRSLNDLGRIHVKLGNFEDAERFFSRSLRIRKRYNSYQGVITTLLEISELDLARKDYTAALKNCEEALALSVKIGSKAKVFRAHKILTSVYKASGDPEKALEHYELFHKTREETLGDEQRTKIKNLRQNFETQRSKQEAEIYRLKNVELKSAYEEIAKKNRDITAGIRYAARIQQAMLPTEERLQEIIPQSFIFFKPRDIVSGDFYHISEKNGLKFLVMADCTGHGVPGAFMTMLGNDLLNHIISDKNIYSPKLILEEMDLGVRRTLHQQHGSSSHDGMDISIVCINSEKGVLRYAGAKSPLYHFRDCRLNMLKGSKFPVGGAQYNKPKVFEEHEIEIHGNDTFFMSSDGFQDQFEKGEGKKFMSSRFRKLLTDISEMNSSEQQSCLEESFTAWKKDGNQTDDVLVIGFRL